MCGGSPYSTLAADRAVLAVLHCKLANQRAYVRGQSSVMFTMKAVVVHRSTWIDTKLMAGISLSVFSPRQPCLAAAIVVGLGTLGYASYMHR